MSDRKPVIGLPACVREVGDLTYHMAGLKYLRAVAAGADAVPIIVPSLGVDGAESIDLDTVLSHVDGFLVTGSPSNVEPHLYGGPDSAPGTLHDPARDATSLPMIEAAIERGLPVLALCRGLQELNVALGGTLHQRLHELPGRMDHREIDGLTAADRYGPSHGVTLAENGLLAQLTGSTALTVNSLHAQGIDKLGSGLIVEATAPDSTIEAVRYGEPDRFVLGIQWHPEWRFHDNPFGRMLFAAFGRAVRGLAPVTSETAVAI